MVDTNLPPNSQPVAPANPNPSWPSRTPTSPTSSFTSPQNFKRLGRNRGLMAMIGVLGIILFLGVVAAATYFLSPKRSSISLPSGGSPAANTIATTSGDICPTDTKTCPDGAKVGRLGPECDFVVCPSPLPIPSEHPNPGVMMPLVTGATKTDGQGPAKDIVVFLPVGSTFTSADSNLTKNVVINNVAYVVTLTGQNTLCANPSDTSCTYQDQSLIHTAKVRIWKNSQGNFAINPISINVDGYPLDYLIVEKPNQAIFSIEELTTWQTILTTLQAQGHAGTSPTNL